MNPNDWEAFREAVGFVVEPLERANVLRERQCALLERIAVALEAGNERRGDVVDALVALGVTMEGRR